MSVARFLTDFADEAVVLPLATAILLLFVALSWSRGALAWLLAVVGTLGSMLLLKLVVLACGACWFGPALNSPSGHTAAGTMIYGGLAALVLRRRTSPALCAACVVSVALLIGGTRLWLHVHSVAEVVVGGLAGLAGALVFVRAAGPPPPRLRAWHLLGVCAACAAALHGTHMPAEGAIRRTAFGLWSSCRAC